MRNDSVWLTVFVVRSAKISTTSWLSPRIGKEKKKRNRAILYSNEWGKIDLPATLKVAKGFPHFFAQARDQSCSIAVEMDYGDESWESMKDLAMGPIGVNPLLQTEVLAPAPLESHGRTMQRALQFTIPTGGNGYAWIVVMQLGESLVSFDIHGEGLFRDHESGWRAVIGSFQLP